MLVGFQIGLVDQYEKNVVIESVEKTEHWTEEYEFCKTDEKIEGISFLLW
jgi:hypothetical protein